MEDPEAHLTAFHTQMLLVGGSDAVRCKLFMSTLTGMIVYAFKKGVRLGSFSKSLNCSHPKTFAEVRRRAVEHIASEGEAYEKCTTAPPIRPRAQIRTQPARVHEAATERGVDTHTAQHVHGAQKLGQEAHLRDKESPAQGSGRRKERGG